MQPANNVVRAQTQNSHGSAGELTAARLTVAVVCLKPVPHGSMVATLQAAESILSC